MTRALVVIDGEHYAPVVRDALAELPYEVAGAWLAGGEEKLRGGDEYGVPLYRDLGEALAACEPELVYDLSDEPVLGPRERFLVASRVLAAGIPYAGADFRFDPPPLAPFPLPSLGIVGTGKRVGKTAVSGHAARLLARDREVIVVAMGRGGPPEPEVAEFPPSPAELLALSRAGRHAASDYLEDAALAGVVTIGCRRAGGGLAGATAFSNVLAGADEALARSPDLVIFEGSGAALPPVQTSRRVLVAPAGSDVTGYLNAYRLLTSDLLVLTMAEGGVDTAAIRGLRPEIPIVPVVLRPRPIEPIAGRSVAFFSTAPASAHPCSRRTCAKRTAQPRSRSRATSPAARSCGATSSAPRRTSGSSSSRPPRSTSSPRRHSRAGSRSSWSTTRCSRPSSTRSSIRPRAAAEAARRGRLAV